MNRVFKIDDPYKLKLLFTHHQIADIPDLFGKRQYIFTNPSAVNLLDDYPTSIVVSQSKGLDLSIRDNVCLLISERIRRLSERETDFFVNCEEDDLWNSIGIFALTRKLALIEMKQGEVYKIFKSLGANYIELIKSCVDNRHIPVPILFSTMMTFFLKMENREELRGVVSSIYIRDLDRAAHGTKNVKNAVLNYLTGEKTFFDFMMMLLEIKQ